MALSENVNHLVHTVDNDLISIGALNTDVSEASSLYTKDSGNFGRNSNKKVSVSSDRNIRYHLGGPLISVGISRQKFAVPFLTNRFFALIRELGRGIKSGKSRSYWLAQFNRKMSFHFLGYSH